MSLPNTELDPSMIYLHLETVDGAHVLVDQDGRRVAGVRGLELALAYDDVSEYCLRGILCRPDMINDKSRHWKHINRPQKCQPEA